MTRDEDRRWAYSMPEVYDRHLGPVLFEHYATDLAERVAASAPTTVLELAAGTGIVTERLVEALPLAAVTATDLSEAMVERGAAKVPGAVWRQADALDLPFEASTFDVVACQFGVMFFPDRPKAFREADRVLVDGGELLFNVWASVEDNHIAGAVQDALTDLFPDDPPTFLTSVPYGYHDRAAITADLSAGGFTLTTWDVVTVSVPAVAGDTAIGYVLGTPVLTELAARTSDVDGAARAVTEAVGERLGAESAPTQLSAIVVSAHQRSDGA